MKQQLIILIVAVLLIVVGLSGCSENRDSRFVGTWKYANYLIDLFPTMKFFSDGTGFVGDVSITWEVDSDDMLVIRGDGKPRIYYYSFSNDGKELTLTVPVIDITRTYIKQ